MDKPVLLLFLVSIVLILFGTIYKIDARREGMKDEIGIGLVLSGVLVLGLSFFVLFLRFVVR